MSTDITELKMWKFKLNRLNEKPPNGIDVLRLCNQIILPSIYMLLKLLYILPV